MTYAFEMTTNVNQRFDTNIGDDNFEFEFRTFRGVMYANVKINGEIADVNVVCIPNKSLFNSKVNARANGIFMFESVNSDYVKASDFNGITTNFVFVKNEN